MYTQLTDEERKQIRSKYGKDNLFRLLFIVMFNNEALVLSPEDTWCEARRCVLQIGEADEESRDIEAMALWRELQSRYINMAEDSATRVMLATFLMLLNKYPTIEGHPFKEVCTELKNSLRSMPKFDVLYKKCHLEEDKMEKDGKFIEIVDYLESFLADTAESPNDNSYKETESFIKEQLNTAKLMSIYEMRIIENIISRLNDKYGHRFQLLLDEFRYYIDQQIENQSRPTQINTQGGPAIMGGEFNDPHFISHKQLESK